MPLLSSSVPAGRLGVRPIIAGGLALALAGCAGSPPDTLGNRTGQLAPCPPSPNCVHSGDRHPEGTEPFLLVGDWLTRSGGELAVAVSEAIESLPRTEVVQSEALATSGGELYLHAEARSLVFRFVDDLEVHHEPGSTELVVRSASRVGRSDLGVNTRRVEELRDLLASRGVVLP